MYSKLSCNAISVGMPRNGIYSLQPHASFVENRRRADTRGCSTPRAPLSGNLGTPAAIQPDGPSAHRRRLLTASIGLRSVRPLTTGLERVRLGAAAQRPTARCAGCERSRPRSAGREHTGADCAPREIGRPRTPVLHRPSACSCERRWRRGGTRVGSLPNLPVWAGLRRAWSQCKTARNGSKCCVECATRD